MSSPNIKQETQEEEDSIIEYSNIERRLFSAIEKFAKIFENMPKPPKSHRSNWPSVSLNDISQNVHMQIATMDEPNRIMANKVINVFLLKVWRRRCDEVHNLHDLVQKYQQQVREREKELVYLSNYLTFPPPPPPPFLDEYYAK